MLVRVSPSLWFFNRQPFEEVEGGGGCKSASDCKTDPYPLRT
jgi:hypothetical protein